MGVALFLVLFFVETPVERSVVVVIGFGLLGGRGEGVVIEVGIGGGRGVVGKGADGAVEGGEVAIGMCGRE